MIQSSHLNPRPPEGPRTVGINTVGVGGQPHDRALVRLQVHTVHVVVHRVHISAAVKVDGRWCGGGLAGVLARRRVARLASTIYMMSPPPSLLLDHARLGALTGSGSRSCSSPPASACTGRARRRPRWARRARRLLFFPLPRRRGRLWSCKGWVGIISGMIERVVIHSSIHSFRSNPGPPNATATAVRSRVCVQSIDRSIDRSNPRLTAAPVRARRCSSGRRPHGPLHRRRPLLRRRPHGIAPPRRPRRRSRRRL